MDNGHNGALMVSPIQRRNTQNLSNARLGTISTDQKRRLKLDALATVQPDPLIIDDGIS
jgi:hypothetical protein